MAAKMSSIFLRVEGDWSVFVFPPPACDLDGSSLSPSAAVNRRSSTVL